MPQTKERKREYMRDFMRRQRAEARGTNTSGPLERIGTNGFAFTPDDIATIHRAMRALAEPEPVAEKFDGPDLGHQNGFSFQPLAEPEPLTPLQKLMFYTDEEKEAAVRDAARLGYPPKAAAGRPNHHHRHGERS
jgi:hypothetical protein